MSPTQTTYSINTIEAPVWDNADETLRKKIVQLGLIEYIQLEMERALEKRKITKQKLLEELDIIV